MSCYELFIHAMICTHIFILIMRFSDGVSIFFDNLPFIFFIFSVMIMCTQTFICNVIITKLLSKNCFDLDLFFSRSAKYSLNNRRSRNAFYDMTKEIPNGNINYCLKFKNTYIKIV